MENVHLAQKWSRKHPDVVVGLDISGDPTQGSIEWIGPLILEAKRLGIPVSCHLSEVKPNDQNQKQVVFAENRTSSAFLNELYFLCCIVDRELGRNASVPEASTESSRAWPVFASLDWRNRGVMERS
jgi:hypothetical protein